MGGSEVEVGQEHQATTSPPPTASVLVLLTLWDVPLPPDLRRAERLWTWWVEKDGSKWWNHLQRMWVASFPLQETLEMERKPPPCVQIKESCRGSQAFGHPKARLQRYYCDLKYLNVWVGWWRSGKRIYFCSVLFWFLSCKHRCFIFYYLYVFVDMLKITIKKTLSLGFDMVYRCIDRRKPVCPHRKIMPSYLFPSYSCLCVIFSL